MSCVNTVAKGMFKNLTIVNITWGASSSVLHLQAKAAQTCNAFKCTLIYLYFWHSLKKRKQNLLVKISLVLLQARCVCSYFGLSGCVGVTLSNYWFFTNLISWKHVSLISPNGYDCYLHLFYVILVTVMGSFFIMRLFLFNINRCIKSLFLQTRHHNRMMNVNKSVKRQNFLKKQPLYSFPSLYFEELFWSIIKVF